MDPSQYNDSLSLYGDSHVKDKMVDKMGIPILVRRAPGFTFPQLQVAEQENIKNISAR